MAQPWENGKPGAYLFTLHPSLIRNDRMGSTSREPSIKHYLGKDIYTYLNYVDTEDPVIDKRGYHEERKHVLMVGQSISISGHIVEVDSVNLITDGRPEILQNEDTYNVFFTVSRKDRAQPFNLPFISLRGQVIAEDYFLDDWGFKFRLENFDPQRREVTLQVAEHDSVAKDFIVMTAVVFPQINILWIGCLVMVIGTVILSCTASENSADETHAMRVNLIGTGNVACTWPTPFSRLGWRCGRRRTCLEPLHTLASSVHAQPVSWPATLPEADVNILAVSDRAVAQVAQQLPEDILAVHTSAVCLCRTWAPEDAACSTPCKPSAKRLPWTSSVFRCVWKRHKHKTWPRLKFWELHSAWMCAAFHRPNALRCIWRRCLPAIFPTPSTKRRAASCNLAAWSLTCYTPSCERPLKKQCPKRRWTHKPAPPDAATTPCSRPICVHCKITPNLQHSTNNSLN